jgi:hypothetical protein
MSDFDGESGAVENKKDEHYVAMPKSWESRRILRPRWKVPNAMYN